MKRTQIKASHLKIISLIIYFSSLTFTKFKKQLSKTMSMICQLTKLKEAREKRKSNKDEIDLAIESFDSTTNKTSGTKKDGPLSSIPKQSEISLGLLDYEAVDNASTYNLTKKEGQLSEVFSNG